MSIRKIKSVIEKNKSFLLLTHINPDGDALASELALARLLRQKGKIVYIISEEKVPQMYKFLPDADKIKTNYRNFSKKVDVVVLLDCAKPSRVGKTQELIKNQIVVDIDHHPGRREKADIVLKDTNVSATSILVYKLFKEMKVKIDKATALLLYVGIATDTGFFRYANTSSRTYRIASELVNLGVQPNYVSKQLYESESLSRLKLLGLSLNTLKLYNQAKICTMETTNAMYKATKTRAEHTENFVNLPRSIKGVSVAIFFKEEKDKNTIKVSFRSKEKVDVDKIARNFGGGGHPQASGCTLRGKIDEVEKRVLKVVRKYIR